MTRRDKIVTLFAVGGLLLLAASCFGVFIPGGEIAVSLALGWLPFLHRVGPQIRVRWDLVGSAAVYLVALVVGTHLFLRWLYREMGKGEGAGSEAPVWKWRWTLGGLALVLLMFVAGTAMVGITHQVAWLVRSPEPLYRRGGRLEANKIKCQSNLRQIGQGLALYARAHGGHYPDDLRALVLEEDLTPEVFVCPSSQDERSPGMTPQEWAEHLMELGHCSYTYVGKAMTDEGVPSRVVAVEPLKNHEYGMNVLRADGQVEWLDRPAAEKLLAEVGFERVEPKKP